jgi:hypothetical protein
MEGLKMHYYVCGPMRGIAKFNFPTFDSVAEDLRRVGHQVSNPADHDRETYPGITRWDGFEAGDISKCPQFDLAQAMRWDLEQVLKADAIVLLPGWEKSRGAAIEIVMAKAAGKDVLVTNRMPDATWMYEHYCGPLPEAKVMEEEREEWNPASGWTQPASSAQEVRMIDPDTGGAKGVKLARFDLMPATPLKREEIRGAQLGIRVSVEPQLWRDDAACECVVVGRGLRPRIEDTSHS